jgi:hypothetical protein
MYGPIMKIFYWTSMDEFILVSDADWFLIDQAKLFYETRLGKYPLWPDEVIYIGDL